MRMNTSDKQILIVEDNNKNMEKLCEVLKDIKDVYIMAQLSRQKFDIFIMN